MVALLGLLGVMFVISSLADHYVRSACHGLVLSNGVEVLVNGTVHAQIERDYAASSEFDEEKRWDDAVLNALRHERPREWRYLIQSLNVSQSSTPLGTRRSRQTLNV